MTDPKHARTQDEQGPDSETLLELRACCLAWERRVCVMGNVQAGDAADAIERTLARLAAHDALVEALLLSTFWLTRVGNFHMTPGATITARCLADGVDADISKGELAGVAERVAKNDALLAALDAAKGAKRT